MQSRARRVRLFWRHIGRTYQLGWAVGDPLVTETPNIFAWFQLFVAAVLLSVTGDADPGATSPGAITGCKQGIMARSRGPSCSMGCVCSCFRVARKLGQPFSFSSIPFLAKLPSLISARSFFISSLVC